MLTALAQELVVVREHKMHFTKCALHCHLAHGLP